MSARPHLLLTPGPTPLHPAAREALGHEALGHMDPEVFALNGEIQADLRTLYGAPDGTLTALLAGTGSLGMEAGFANLAEPGDEVLVGVNGSFGARMAEMAARHGARVRTVTAAPGEPLDLSGLRGIVDYEPTELVVTARCGTPLAELEAELARNRQMLGFEPPHFGPGATVGGAVAAGLAGPARATVGGARDYVLGVRLINGKGELLTFGGQVMKNVAGYDLSRALAGSRGQLGVIAEVSLKVLPVAPASTSAAESSYRSLNPRSSAISAANSGSSASRWRRAWTWSRVRTSSRSSFCVSSRGLSQRLPSASARRS